MKTITTAETAAQLGLARRTIQKWCAVLALERVGRDYLLTEDQVAQIRAVAHNKRGRPRKENKDKGLTQVYKWLQ